MGFDFSGSGTSALPRAYLDGMILQNNGAFAQAINVTPGVARDATNAVNLTNTTTFYKTLASNWVAGAGGSGSPVGGLDTGTVAANTWYAVFAISNGTLTDYLLSININLPTLPTGYTYSRYIGAIKTNASLNIINFHQYGDDFVWDTPPSDLGSFAIVNTATLFTVSAPPFANITVQSMLLYTNTTAAGGQIFAWSPAQGTAATSSNIIVESAVISVFVAGLTPFLAVDSLGRLYATSNFSGGNSLTWNTWKWKDPRGRN